MPLFALAGAPKAATTALANALADHPQIAFSVPKEPSWFGSDLEPLRRLEGLRSRSDYLACFDHRSRRFARWRGEASTLYLSSPDAIDQLDAQEPDALVVVVVRNPVDVAYAFHMQMVFRGYEPLVDFADAWHARRHRDPSTVVGCPVPRLLDYEQVATLGQQVERLVARVGAARSHVIVYDDLVQDPGPVLDDLGRRLDLSEAIRALEPTNRAMTLRSPRLARVLRSSTGRRSARLGKSALPGAVGRRLISAKDRLLRTERARGPLPTPLREELVQVFTPEVRRLEALLDRDLGHWLHLRQPQRARS